MCLLHSVWQLQVQFYQQLLKLLIAFHSCKLLFLPYLQILASKLAVDLQTSVSDSG
jgi:hypothetical protein